MDRIDIRSAIGSRDRALLLLIATAGLRSKELQQFELSVFVGGPAKCCYARPRRNGIGSYRCCRRLVRRSPTMFFTRGLRSTV